MRILMLSKACLVGIYQQKLEEIAKTDDVDLIVAVPPSWREGKHKTRLERAYTNGYELVVEPIAFNGSFHTHFYPRLGHLIRTSSPDIVHIDEEPYNLATYQALALARRSHVHTLWFSWQNLNRSYPWPFRAFERYNLAHADHAIVGSDGAAQVWRQKGYTGPMSVIPQFGVDPDVFHPRERRSHSEQRFVIGYAGRLVPEKGVDVLLKAVAGLPGNWKLLIAGQGPELVGLKSLAQQWGIQEHVSFEGHVSSLRMPAFYRELDALVAPSQSRSNWVEQFGRILIEAMSSGVIVIGSDSGEIPNVIGDCGLTFPENDERALRYCLERVMHDADLRARFIRCGREQVLSRYTQSQIAQQTVAVYRQIMENPPRSNAVAPGTDFPTEIEASA
jgi:glycosyltransferase involved in cell wall biosynthesis